MWYCIQIMHNSISQWIMDSFAIITHNIVCMAGMLFNILRSVYSCTTLTSILLSPVTMITMCSVKYEYWFKINIPSYCYTSCCFFHEKITTTLILGIVSPSKILLLPQYNIICNTTETEPTWGRHDLSYSLFPIQTLPASLEYCLGFIPLLADQPIPKPLAPPLL